MDTFPVFRRSYYTNISYSQRLYALTDRGEEPKECISPLTQILPHLAPNYSCKLRHLSRPQVQHITSLLLWTAKPYL